MKESALAYTLLWRLRLVLLVPASLFLWHSGVEFGRALGLLAPAPLETTLDASRDRVFDVYLAMLEVDKSSCKATCTASAPGPTGSGQTTRVEFSRRGTVEMSHLVNGSLEAAHLFVLQPTGERTRLSVRIAYPRYDDVVEQRRFERLFASKYEASFKEMASLVEELAQSDEVP